MYVFLFFVGTKYKIVTNKKLKMIPWQTFIIKLVFSVALAWIVLNNARSMAHAWNANTDSMTALNAPVVRLRIPLLTQIWRAVS